MKSKDPLYCVVVNICNKKGVLIRPLVDSYIHAKTQQEAYLKYCLSAPDRKRYQIVSVAPVVGYKIQDKQGLILSV
jgi:hypothetical protein